MPPVARRLPRWLRTCQTQRGTGVAVLNDEGLLTAIVEQRDCTPEQAEITLINSGIFAFNRQQLFTLLHELRPENAQGEYYLTDVVNVGVARAKGWAGGSRRAEWASIIGHQYPRASGRS